MKIVLENGIELRRDCDGAKGLQRWADEKEVNVRIFLAIHPNKYKEYLAVEGDTPVFASQSYEAMAAHIDIMAIVAQDKKGE